MSSLAYLAGGLLYTGLGHVPILQAAEAQSILLHEFLPCYDRFDIQLSCGRFFCTRRKTNTSCLECMMTMSLFQGFFSYDLLL